FFQAEDGIRDKLVTGVQTCALPISLEYSSAVSAAGAAAVDVRGGTNWIVRDNIFRNFAAPPGRDAAPAVLMSSQASGTLTERNTFLNCAVAVAYGAPDATGVDHVGGIVRNNMIFRAAGQPG